MNLTDKEVQRFRAVIIHLLEELPKLIVQTNTFLEWKD